MGVGVGRGYVGSRPGSGSDAGSPRGTTGAGVLMGEASLALHRYVGGGVW